MNQWIEILGMPVYSKKNHKVISGKKLLSSEKVRQYEKDMLPVYLSKRREWNKQFNPDETPVTLEMYFIRPTKAKFDWVNMAQLPLDMMQTAGWIEDDDCYTITPSFTGWEVNKDLSKCGVKVRIR